MKYRVWIMNVDKMDRQSPRNMGEFDQQGLDSLLRNAKYVGESYGIYKVYTKVFRRDLQIFRVEEIEEDDLT